MERERLIRDMCSVYVWVDTRSPENGNRNNNGSTRLFATHTHTSYTSGFSLRILTAHVTMSATDGHISQKVSWISVLCRHSNVSYTFYGRSSASRMAYMRTVFISALAFLFHFFLDCSSSRRCRRRVNHRSYTNDTNLPSFRILLRLLSNLNEEN